MYGVDAYTQAIEAAIGLARQTAARFAFLHPHTSMDLVRQILDRMA